jgi:FkbM family methyltransferase
MNLLFEHKNPFVESTWSSTCRFEIGSDIMNFLDKEDMPIRFHVKKLLNGESIYSIDMYTNHWASHPAVEYCYIEAETAKGVSIFRDDWDPIKHGCLSDSLFYTWCLKNPGSNGLIIGANDGTGGDYVVPYMRGLIQNMVLVEASERTYESLKRNYQNDSKVRTINTLVSTKTEKIKFYESTSGPGLVNSVYKNFANFFNEEILEVEKEAIGINEIIAESIKEIEIDWLHIDVEGLDGELIMALDFEIFKPKVIIYENISRKGQKISSEELIDFLRKKGYQVFGLDPQLNNIAILKTNNNEDNYR